MAAYKKCPRCELNWIKMDEEYCDVCKAELKMKGGISLIEDDEELEEERICPIGKINYLAEDEEICAQCRAEKGNDILPSEQEKEDEDEGWRDFVDDEVIEDEMVDDEDEELSLNALEDEEMEEFDEDEEEVDDYDDLENYDDEDDYDDEDEEEEEDEEN